MNVVFDGVCFGDGPVTGVGRSFLNGLQAYARQYPGESVLLVPDGAPRPTAIPGVHVVTAPRGALRRQLGLPTLLRELRASVLHSSVAAVPLRAPCPTIATVHDLPWLHAESGERTSWRRRFATRRSLRAAAAVIAPSLFTLAAARRLLADHTSLHHIPHGIVLPEPVPTAARTGPFVVLGGDRPRKNRGRVAAAHVLAVRLRPDLPPLRFVGPPHDWVDEAEKDRLLRHCTASVQCSLFEGFGMPVLEAMAHGAPLLCSDIPPFRELAAGVAMFVDPRNIEAIAAAILELGKPPADQQRAAAGRERAATFAATTTAAKWRELHLALARR